MSKVYQSKFYQGYLSLFSTAFKTIVRNLRSMKFEPEVGLLDRFVGLGDTCIDVGGAYGRYALALSRLIGPKGKVYSFEPGAYSHRVFAIIKWFHRLNNVLLNKIALSDRQGEVQLCLPVKNTGKIGASLAYISNESPDGSVHEVVPMTTLDHFCEREHITSVAFIKCDTEGAELLVFQGGRNIIESCRPSILSEVDSGHMGRYGLSVADMENFFIERGYAIFSLSQDHKSLKGRKHIQENGNYFFVHQDKLVSLGQQ